MQCETISVIKFQPSHGAVDFLRNLGAFCWENSNLDSCFYFKTANSLLLVVIKDYESAFDAVTLIQIPQLIYLSDFQPLSIAKVKKFSSTTRVLQKIFSDKVHTILIEEVLVQTTLHDGTSFHRLTSIIIGLKYLYQPSNFLLNILTLTCNV